MLLDNRAEVFEEQVLPENPAQDMQFSIGAELRPDHGGMVLPEVNPFIQRQMTVIGQWTLVPNALEGSCLRFGRIERTIDGLPNNIEPPKSKYSRTMFRVRRRIRFFEVADRRFREVVRIVVHAQRDVFPVPDVVVFGKLARNPMPLIHRVRADDNLMGKPRL